MDSEGEIRCPCKKSVNQEWLKLNRVVSHIIENVFNLNYTMWIYHGEKDVVPQREIPTIGVSSSAVVVGDEMADALLDLANEISFKAEDANEVIDEADEDVMSYDEHFKELQSELWSRFKKISLLNFIVKLMHLMVMYKWTNRSFDMLC